MEEKPTQPFETQGNMPPILPPMDEGSDGSDQLEMQPRKEGRSKSWFDGKYHRPSLMPRPDGKRELRQKDCWDKLAYSWPTWKKCMYLASIAGIQISMNFNTSVFPSAVNPISEHFGISTQAARVGQMIYLVFYSFGCELWAPWSEEFGRWPILQLSLFFINIWQIPCSVAPNFGTIVVCRALVSLTSDHL
jgi:hypothetical protein